MNLNNIMASLGIICFLSLGIIGGDWRTKCLAILYAVANTIIFIKW